MKVFDYPFPCRKLLEGDEDTKNVGFAQGVFSDGRPFHAECWAADGATHITLFFSAFRLENIQQNDIVEYLVSEGVIELVDGMPCYCGAGIIFDDSKHKMISATITIGDEDNVFVKSDIQFHAWKCFYETVHDPQIL